MSASDQMWTIINDLPAGTEFTSRYLRDIVGDYRGLDTLLYRTLRSAVNHGLIKMVSKGRSRTACVYRRCA